MVNFTFVLHDILRLCYTYHTFVSPFVPLPFILHFHIFIFIIIIIPFIYSDGRFGCLPLSSHPRSTWRQSRTWPWGSRQHEHEQQAGWGGWRRRTRSRTPCVLPYNINLQNPGSKQEGSSFSLLLSAHHTCLPFATCLPACLPSAALLPHALGFTLPATFHHLPGRRRRRLICLVPHGIFGIVRQTLPACHAPALCAHQRHIIKEKEKFYLLCQQAPTALPHAPACLLQVPGRIHKKRIRCLKGRRTDDGQWTVLMVEKLEIKTSHSWESMARWGRM